MKGVITIFALPYEIENLANILHLLKRNSIFLSEEMKYTVDLTMCMDLTRWYKAEIPARYIRERTKELCEKYLDWCELNLRFEEKGEILGCVSQRRYSWKKNKDADFFIWLDPDMFFRDDTLFYLSTSWKMLREEGKSEFIISPQTSKLGDHTWDALCHPSFLEYPYSTHNENTNIHQNVLKTSGDLELKLLPVFKFGGGWLNLLTKDLIDLVGIPEELGHYGLEDTFIMSCCYILAKHSKYNPEQYVLENLVVGELVKARADNTLKKYLPPIDMKDQFRATAEKGWPVAMNKLLTRYSISYGK